MNWTDKLSRTNNCVTIGKCKISPLFFADDLVLLVSSESRLQHTLNGFAAACDIAGMKISTSKTEVLHLSRNPVQCSLASRQSIIETGREVRLSWGRIHE